MTMKRIAVLFAALLLAVSVPAGEMKQNVSIARTGRTNYWKKERLGYFVRVDENGKIIRTEGFYQIDGKPYFLCGNSGRRVQGWLTYKGGTYYFDPQTGVQALGYQVIDGVPYYFDPGSSPAGRRKTGCIFIDGKRYHFSYKKGKLVTGWISGGARGDHRYYIGGNGAMKLGWTRIASENRTYYFEPKWGYALKGPQTIDGKKYLFVEGTNAVGRRWVNYKGNKYYCDPKTAVVTTGKAVIDGKEYHFDDRGRLVVIPPKPEKQWIAWNPSWPYADYSRIHTGSAVLTRPAKGNGIVVCVNAGHGTEGGESVKTLCHPDGSSKVTDGSTGAGAVYAIACSSGTTMLDGTDEGTANLQMAMILRDGKEIIPDGDTVFRAGDEIVFCTRTFNRKKEPATLIEHPLPHNSKWDGRIVKEYPKRKDSLLVMIRRGDEVIVPKGHTELKGGDVLVMLKR